VWCPHLDKYCFRCLCLQRGCGKWRAKFESPNFSELSSVRSILFAWPHVLSVYLSLMESATKPKRKAKSCGFLVMRSDNSFLLMKHPNRYDLLKGHMEPGETEQQTALRGNFFRSCVIKGSKLSSTELLEESGILADDIIIDPTFRFEEVS
jgi:hypothetical protein